MHLVQWCLHAIMLFQFSNFERPQTESRVKFKTLKYTVCLFLCHRWDTISNSHENLGVAETPNDGNDVHSNDDTKTSLCEMSLMHWKMLVLFLCSYAIV